MTDGLLQKLNATIQAGSVRNHYGSSEIYTFTIDQNAVAKPRVRPASRDQPARQGVKLAARSASDLASTGEEGRGHRAAGGDESFEGYAASRCRRQVAARGLVFHRRHGLVTRRRFFCSSPAHDDMISHGGETYRRWRSKAVVAGIRGVGVAVVGLATRDGERLSPRSSSAVRMSAKPISKHSAGTQDSRTSSAREDSSSSMRSRNPRLESCCADCWSPGIRRRTPAATDRRIVAIFKEKENHHAINVQFFRFPSGKA